MPKQRAVLEGSVSEGHYITRNGFLGFWDENTEELVHKCLESPENNLSYVASWLTLLREIQRLTPTTSSRSNSSANSEHVGERGVLIAIKGARQTLDLMPEGVKRPYAITTLGSIVLLAARLGLHWKQFDRANDRYLADGNGLLLTGFSVPHLGIMFSFTRYGSPSAANCPEIDSDDAVKFCFGLVSTYFRPRNLGPAPKYLSDIPRNLDVLRFGSRGEMAVTFRLMGFEISDSFMDSIESAEHLFPVVFEIVGMLARFCSSSKPRGGVLIPNSLPYLWNAIAFSPLGLLLKYARTVHSEYKSIWVSIGFGDASFIPDDLTSRPSLIIAECDEWLYKRRERMLIVIRAHIKHVIRFFGRGQPFRTTSLDDGSQMMVENNFVGIYLFGILKGVGEDNDFQLGYQKGHTNRSLKEEHEVWLVLMLRMFAWLHAHTFHSADIQLPKSDVMGSEQPVYIS
ncbi:hypothetical protein QBC43DRAFT_352186 [Cladorrhinum sp. PSN259]|nr:hypothetical protein QBC43DRAFT_352186 [Cladorrhinum sp. PSN259]